MKVKIIEGYTSEVEKEINLFIINKNVIEIKFSTTMNEFGAIYAQCLIIYEGE